MFVSNTIFQIIAKSVSIYKLFCLQFLIFERKKVVDDDNNCSNKKETVIRVLEEENSSKFSAFKYLK